MRTGDHCTHGGNIHDDGVFIIPIVLAAPTRGYETRGARALPAVVTSPARDLSAVCMYLCSWGRKNERETERESEKGGEKEKQKNAYGMYTSYVYIIQGEEKVGIFGFIKIVLRDACAAGLIIIMTTVHVFRQSVY